MSSEKEALNRPRGKQLQINCPNCVTEREKHEATEKALEEAIKFSQMLMEENKLLEQKIALFALKDPEYAASKFMRFMTHRFGSNEAGERPE